MFYQYLIDSFKQSLRGNRSYWIWMGSLSAVCFVGLLAYIKQLDEGLIVTGMSDQVSWGAYIANFTFLIGMAAAAVMLVIPAYIFHRKDAKAVVILAEGVAVAACLMAMLFVVVDLGSPERMWHMIPMLGFLNWPQSLLAWDIVVLSGYLVLNISIPIYFLYGKYADKTRDPRYFFPIILVAIAWAIALHTVTAFLFASNSGRPFWHTALLGPRFLASAFASGPAIIVLAFRVIDARTKFNVPEETLRMLSVMIAVALQINLFMLGSEAFTEFYSPTQHAASAHYLFFGIGSHTKLVPWMYTAITIELIAVVLLMVRRYRENPLLLSIACGFTAVGIWVEKGMGLIIPGFVPTPLGEIFEYGPSTVEILVSLGIWAFGLMVFTVLVKPVIAIELGALRFNRETQSAPTSAILPTAESSEA